MYSVIPSTLPLHYRGLKAAHQFLSIRSHSGKFTHVCINVTCKQSFIHLENVLFPAGLEKIEMNWLGAKRYCVAGQK